MKFTPKKSKELARVVKNYNAKLSRLEKNGGELLPGRVSVKDLKNSLKNKTTNDFNREINRLKRFTRRGAETIVTINGREMTKWERKEIGYEVARAKRAITRQLKIMNVPLTLRKQPLGYTRGYLNTNAVRSLLKQYESLDVNKILGIKARSKRMERLEQATKYSYRYSMQAVFQLKENIKEMIDKLSLPEGPHYEALRRRIKNILNKMGLKDFRKLYYASAEIDNFLLQYIAELDGIADSTQNVYVLESMYNILK